MLKKDYWMRKGYSENYADIIIKALRVFLKETGLREEDLEGLLLLLELREKLRKDLNLKEFVSSLLGTLMKRQGILLSEKALKGFGRFYKTQEELEKALEGFGEGLLSCLKTDFEPLELALSYIFSESFKGDYTFTLSVDRRIYSDFLELAGERTAYEFGQKARERVENLLREMVRRKKQEKLKEKLRKR